MGAVYLAREPGGDLVAIKVIHADLSLDEQFALRFEREGSALERLAHPNLIAIRGRGTCREGHWLAMDYVGGGSLEDRLKLKGPWPSHAARELMISLCEGIEHAHQCGILHRDLKPDNVLLRAQDGQALIADFGLALPLDVSQHLTQTGEILGSPGYLAPEQCGLAQPTTPATDVYGLGAVLYAVLTGQPPLTGGTVLAMLDKVLSQRPQPPSLLVENIDPTLEAICLRCLAKDPSERYQSARELRDALQEEPALAAQSKSGVFWAALVGLAALALGLGVWLANDLKQGSFASPSESTLGRSTPAIPSPTSPPSSATPPSFATPSPFATPPPSATPSPLATPLPSGTAFDEALKSRNWIQARALHGLAEGSERPWLGYRLLAAELDWTGEETDEWARARVEAVEELKSDALATEDSRWRSGLAVALMTLGDRNVSNFKSNGARQLVAALEAGVAAAKGPRQRAALWRAIVEILGSHANPAEPLVLTAIENWEREQGGDTWQSQLARSKAAQRAKKSQVFFQALRRGELATYRVGHPWARYEFFRLRLQGSGSPSLNTAFLPQAILDAEAAPASLKVDSALSLASYLLTTGKDPARAGSVLEAHPPLKATSKRKRISWWQIRAAAALETGDALTIRSLLERPDRGASQASAYPEQLMRACAHALLGEPQLAAQAFREALRPAAGVPSYVLILELQAAILVGSHELTLKAARRVATFGDTSLRLRALGAVESCLKLQGPEGRALITDATSAAQAGALIKRVLYPKRDDHARRLIRDGDWKGALDLTLTLHDPAAPPAEDERVFRICHQALRRGLNESPSSSAEWKEAQRRISSFVASHDRFSRPKEVLFALLESLKEVSPSRRRELVTILEQAAQATPVWEECLEAVARIQRRSLQGSLLAERSPSRVKLLRATLAWKRAFPTSPEANLELVLHLRGPRLPADLKSLERQLSKTGTLWWRAKSNLLLLQHINGGSSEEEFCESYAEVFSSKGDPLRRERRKSLLLAAEGLLNGASGTAGTRLLLDWLVATTGPLEINGDPADRLTRARYLHLRAQLALSDNDPSEALAILRSLGPYPKLLPRSSRARMEWLLARAELQLKLPGLNRLRAALELAPFGEGFLTLARHTKGDQRREALERALSYGGSSSQVEQVLQEIEASKLDPISMLRRSFVFHEELKDARPVAYAKALFLRNPKAKEALLLHEALQIESHQAPHWAMKYRQDNAALLQQALSLLPQETQELVRDLEAVARALGGLKTAEIRTALAALRKRQPSQLCDRLRAPVSVAFACQRLARLEGDLGLQADAERELLAYRARGQAPTGLQVWFAEFFRNRGQVNQAREAIKLALKDLSLGPEFVRSRYLFQAALNASASGEDDQALKLLGETLAASDDPVTVAGANLAEAQIRIRRGELSAAQGSLEVAHALCPASLEPLLIQLAFAQARIHVERRQFAAARAMLKQGRSLQSYPHSAASVRSFGAALEAAIFNGEGAHKPAQDASRNAIEHDPNEPFAQIQRLTALAGLGKTEEARRAARELLKRSDMNPGPKAEIAAWLEQLGK